MNKTYKILLSFFLILISGMGFSQSVPSYVPANGLVGWWGFNGNAQDGSGNGNHGTVNNGLSYTADRLSVNNAAIQVIMDWSLCSSPTGFGVTFPVNLVNENYAVSVWVKSYDSTAHNQCIFNSSPHTLIGLGLNYGVNNPRNTISSFFGNGSWLLTNNNITWNSSALQDWKHLVVVKFSNELKYYENGSLVFSHFIMPYGQPLTLDSIRFGSTTVNSGCYEPFYGKIDDIGIWNRALTQQEITNLYNSQLPTQTSLCLPTITTSSPSSVGVDTVVIGGDISNDGGSSIVLRGVCYSTSPNPNMGNSRTEDGSGIGSFNTVLRGLNPSTTYYARSYAKNSNGVVVYGNEVSFTTSAPAPSFACGTSTVSDVDNNTYNTVQIGNQCWTQSNLKTGRYRNGDTIPTGLNNSAWANTISGAYAIYNNDSVNDGLYVKLYNHYAVTDSRGLCPTGWHVPMDVEWKVLALYLDPSADTITPYWGSSVSRTAGGALKSTVIQPTLGGWFSPNTGATNSSGFTGLAGGRRVNNGEFNFLSTSGFWWTSSFYSGSNAWFLYLYYNLTHFNFDTPPLTWGLSVRCLKD